jgi:predicted ATPase with chaperone activity
VPAGALDEVLPLSAAARDAWVDVCREQALTGRGAAIVRRVAATAADLDDVAVARPEHLVLAAAFRQDVP